MLDSIYHKTLELFCLVRNLSDLAIYRGYCYGCHYITLLNM